MTTLIPHRARGAVAMATAAILLALAGFYAGRAAADQIASASATKKVGIANFAFKPGTLTVSKGTKVSFANSDGVAHTATGKGFDTGNIGPGKSATVKFSKAGTFAYHCTIHPSMHGKIIVK